MKEKTEPTRVIILEKRVVNLVKLYRNLKTELELNGYIFHEAKQKIKESGEYGQYMEFTIKGFKAYDDFGKHLLDIVMKFEKVKKLENGNYILSGIISIITKVQLDYEDRWVKTNFTRWLFEVWIHNVLLYRKYKSKYYDPAFAMQSHFDSFIKEQLGIY